MGVIGDTLSEARIRRAVDLEDVEAATGIRVRYLRAIEAEDWGVLPEEFYVRSFIRKYAQFLDVAPEPLVEQYRRREGGAGRGGAPTSPFARTTSRRAEALRRRRRRQAVYAWAGAAVFLAAVVVAIVLLASGGGGTGEATGGGAKAGAKGGAVAGRKHGGAKAGARGAGHPTTVALRIDPTAEVWACVLDAQGKRLVNGVTLLPGEPAGPFHSGSYTAAFGNDSVRLLVDGKVAPTPSTAGPLGISVDPHGTVRELPKGRRPSCE
ncbi:MAG: helix-turn-helix domain-containing protein [Actinobacteria bacterium]|nr:helix-turn-helix domain-containing protein [Actinomycetota bacterium]